MEIVAGVPIECWLLGAFLMVSLFFSFQKWSSLATTCSLSILIFWLWLFEWKEDTLLETEYKRGQWITHPAANTQQGPSRHLRWSSVTCGHVIRRYSTQHWMKRCRWLLLHVYFYDCGLFLFILISFRFKRQWALHSNVVATVLL